MTATAQPQLSSEDVEEVLLALAEKPRVVYWFAGFPNDSLTDWDAKSYQEHAYYHHDYVHSTQEHAYYRHDYVHSTSQIIPEWG